MPKRIMTLLLLFLFVGQATGAYAWSNGGFSADSSHPDYGTHDWIAQHALDWLPAQKKQYITDNLQMYLYGTELPDNGQVSDGIGDTGLHHIYYTSSGALLDDAAARRAEQEYQTALDLLEAGDYARAAEHAGAMTHYISDVAVFGHVMGKTTDWGAETHHSDYEDYANDRTSSYTKTYIKQLQFDGDLTTTSAGDAASVVALDTTLDGGGTYTAKWMDLNYNWGTTTFTDRSWESVNLAVNEVADVLSTLYDAYSPQTRVLTTITCIASKATAKANEQITVSGVINADVSATVVIQKSTGGSWVDIATTTSLHGAYTSQISLPAGARQIRSSWSGDSTHDGAISQQLSLTINSPTGGMRITVLDEQGSPLTSATIASTVTPAGQPTLQATTITNGTATFSEIAAGNYRVSASKIGYVTQLSDILVTTDSTATTTITIKKVVMLGSLKISVVDEGGAAVVDAEIASKATPSEQHEMKATTDSNGSHTFNDIRVGSYTFNTSKAGYVAKLGTALVVEGQTTNLIITLSGGNPSIPGFPISAVFLALVLVLGYFIIFRININK
jgi:hypothetical protein